MTYDDELADRVRVLVHALDGVDLVEEKKMFGALSFMVHGRLAVAVSGDGVLVPVGAEALPALVAREHVHAMTMGSRTSDSWVRVDAEELTSDDELAGWVARGAAGGAGGT